MGLSVNVFGRKGQERQVARPLDRKRNLTLVTRTGANLPAGLDLAAVRQITPQLVAFLIVDSLFGIGAKGADTPHWRTVTSRPASAFAVAVAVARPSRAGSRPISRWPAVVHSLVCSFILPQGPAECLALRDSFSLEGRLIAERRIGVQVA